jgi:predicted nucleotidyltransferase
MLEALISSKTRLNILLKFFLNPGCTSYLRELATEFNESTNAIRLELNRFEAVGMLETQQDKNRKVFKANKSHPLFKDIRSILLKYTGIDQIIENIIKKLGEPEKVYLTGDFAKGKNGDIIDIIIIGDINQNYLIKLIEKVEKQIEKRIRYLVYNNCEKVDLESSNKYMMIWSKS